METMTELVVTLIVLVLIGLILLSLLIKAVLRGTRDVYEAIERHRVAIADGLHSVSKEIEQIKWALARLEKQEPDPRWRS